MNYTYQHNGTTYAVNLEPNPDGSYQALIGDRRCTVRAQRVRQGWLLDIDGQRTLVYSAAQGSERYLNADGQHFTLTVPAAQKERRKATAAGSGGTELRAQMPGQVVDVQVTAGSTVTKGQTLVVLEAMKMEIRVSAPADGTVQRVQVAKGDVVERGQLLVEIGG